MKKAKKLFGMLFIMVALVCVMTLSASAADTFNKETGELVISDTYVYGYKERTNIKSVIINEGALRIEHEAFRGCTNLESVILPESLTVIDQMAFADCEKLKKIYIPKNVSYIGHFAFGNCVSLEELSIPARFWGQNSTMHFEKCPIKKLTIIGSGAYTLGERNLPMDKLEEVVIESGINRIGYRALASKYLYKVVLNDDIKYIDEYAFAGAIFNSITLPSKITRIANGTFSGCSNLNNVLIPDGVTSIGEYAFNGCGRLNNLSLPDSVTSIGASAFAYCTFTDFDFPDKISVIQPRTFYYCRPLKNITLDNITHIGHHAFYQSGLSDVVIPEECTYIGEAAFASIHLKNVTIKNDIVEIEKHAFYNENAYSNSNANVAIYASCGSTGHNYILGDRDNRYYLCDFISTKHHFSDEWYYNSATCSSKGTKYKKCIYCSEQTDVEITSDVLPHNYKESVVYSATCTMTGTKRVTCYNCGNSYTETIEATGHDFEGSKCKNCPFDRATECSCNCHAGGIKTFFFSIINFFQKLFGQNKICACGANH